jgi:hypothetical protein
MNYLRQKPKNTIQSPKRIIDCISYREIKPISRYKVDRIYRVTNEQADTYFNLIEVVRDCLELTHYGY